NDDDLVDLVFANSLSGGFSEVDSYIYWGNTGSGFDATPLGLPTSGAEDVKVADLDGDNDLDIVFANFWDNSQRHEVDSFVYLNGGGGGFSSTPDVRLPTVGATGVAAADLDGTGRLDLVFACQQNATTYNASSRVYLGGGSGWASTPDIEIPTEGASDVLATKLFKHGTGGYMSVPIRPLEPRETGTFHTLRYTANLGASQSGTIQLVDAITLEVLAETPMVSGSNEWAVANLFHIKLHESIRVVAILDGLGTAQPFALDDLWLNWTQRLELPPVVRGLDISEPSVLRLKSVELSVDVFDGYDLNEELVVLVQHRLNGTDIWSDFLIDSLSYDPDTGTWRTTITPRLDAPVGVYDFRVDATDLDGQFSDWVEFPEYLEVLNNLPTTPVVHLEPSTPVTTTQLRVEMDT
ncbi:MAG: VCBS repeat-containing protein, partial [Thermoplasmata archaeon]|nr:VCBS repeat-containing protein [Thermoplasmata archaeon]